MPLSKSVGDGEDTSDLADGRQEIGEDEKAKKNLSVGKRDHRGCKLLVL
jgi:hypothetical protein